MKMQNIHKNILAVFIGIGLIFLVSAIGLQTTYNPFTGKMDYISNGNFSGTNLSVYDYFFVDNANERIGIGTTTPTVRLEISGHVNVSDGNISINNNRLKTGDVTVTEFGICTNITGFTFIGNLTNAVGC